MARDEHARWPPLASPGWTATEQTVHRYVQIVGKIRMSLVPFRHRWWHTTLQLDTRGLTTGPLPYGDGEVEISFDLLDHRLLVVTSDGRDRSFELGRRPSCAEFHSDLFAALDDLGVQVSIRPVPYDLEGPPFPEDTVHHTYDAEAVTAYWRVLAGTGRVLADFASRFVGEASPVHLFWHRLDLSYSRHARRPAGTGGTGGAEDTQDIVFGFSPGREPDVPWPAFYCHTAPEPDRLVEHPLEPAQARWTTTGSGHRAVLAYDALRRSTDPDRTLLDFFESAYLAGARASGWDVAAHSRGASRARPATF